MSPPTTPPPVSRQGSRRPRGWFSFAFSVLLAALPALAASALPTPGDRPEPGIAEDRSLTADEYAAKGLPDLARPWAGADYKKAHQVLAALAKTDPRQLPRVASPQSGKVFARLASPDNFAAVADAKLTFEQRYALIQEYNFVPQVVLLYVKANAANVGSFDAELLDTYAQLLRLHLARAQWGEAFLADLPPNDPARPQRQKAVASRRDDGVKMIRDAFKYFASPGFRTTELRRFAETLRAIVPPFAALCPPETRAALATDLADLETAEKDPALKAALRTLHDATTPAAKPN